MSIRPQLAIENLFDRRASERLRLSLPANIETLEFVAPVLMLDLGPFGARMVLPYKPRLLDAQLRWLQFDAMGQIIWSADNICGMKFNRPLSSLKLRRTAAASPATDFGDTAEESNLVEAWIRDHS